ncbi:unnamed protein product [Heligmosomoides polygyrus]|uniref:Uncharacterized protein n=1 Tax=Heligmosomoides polygyrus TaxID=6339 RepID=A0A183FJP7_HELPZ|nr:unnamed protein product [Heligmosomoides polygyrus]
MADEDSKVFRRPKGVFEDNDENNDREAPEEDSWAWQLVHKNALSEASRRRLVRQRRRASEATTTRGRKLRRAGSPR